MAWRVRTGTIGKTLDRCQDSVRCCELPDGCVVLIVADGSGEHGDLASAYVADSAIARSMKIESIRRERNPARIVEELIDSVVADYERWILQGTLERREHRSTLGIVLLYDDFVVFGGVGDVFFCLLCDTDVFFSTMALSEVNTRTRRVLLTHQPRFTSSECSNQTRQDWF